MPAGRKKGFLMSDKHKKKLSLAHIGKIGWNKGGKRPEITGEKHPMFGKHHSDKTKQKIIDALKKKFPKGRKPWNKGKIYYQIRDEKHHNWKGNKVGHQALHDWVKKRLGTPSVCEFCKKSGLKRHQIQWANKSQKYKRDLTDWIRLCAKCHKNYDMPHIMRNKKR